MNGLTHNWCPTKTKLSKAKKYSTIKRNNKQKIGLKLTFLFEHITCEHIFGAEFQQWLQESKFDFKVYFLSELMKTSSNTWKMHFLFKNCLLIIVLICLQIEWSDSSSHLKYILPLLKKAAGIAGLATIGGKKIVPIPIPIPFEWVNKLSLF